MAADDGDSDRDAILRRRSRFIAIALSGLSATGGAGCYESHGRDDAAAHDAGMDGGEPVPCLGAPWPEDSGTPKVCLSIAADAGELADAGPKACLDFAPEDGGGEG